MIDDTTNAFECATTAMILYVKSTRGEKRTRVADVVDRIQKSVRQKFTNNLTAILRETSKVRYWILSALWDANVFPVANAHRECVFQYITRKHNASLFGIDVIEIVKQTITNVMRTSVMRTNEVEKTQENEDFITWCQDQMDENTQKIYEWNLFTA